MAGFIRGLTWPVVSLLVIGTAHLIAEAALPDLQGVIGPAVAMPIYLAIGALGALAVVEAGGPMVRGFIAGAVLGVLPVGLQLVGFGLLLGRPPDAVTLAGALGWLGLFWGGAVGTALAVRRPA